MPAPASRAFAKLEHALEVFNLDVRGLVCADFGCNVGGFTDCLLARGASRVLAVDTAYGLLAWRLRNDPRVVVMERTNALHAQPPEGGVDLVAVDLGWTAQRHAVPAALRWLRPRGGGHIVSLIKPHYEAAARGASPAPAGLAPDLAERVRDEVLASMPALGACALQVTTSPIAGAKSSRRGRGNVEFLALLAPAKQAGRERSDACP